MTEWDASQAAVLGLDPRRHAQILGAPGTGKSAVLVEQYRRLVAEDGWGEDDVLVLASGRGAAATLRDRVGEAMGTAVGGTPVRSAVSFAFAVLARSSALDGDAAPRLMTGPVQDELIVASAAEAVARGESVAGLPADLLESPVFRAELREFWRVIDDFGVDPAAFAVQLANARAAAVGGAVSDAPDPDLLQRWTGCATLLGRVIARAERERPGEQTSAAIQRRAAAVIRARGSLGAGEIRVPRLLLVDDAQELGEGALGLVAACASAGGSVWAFGDPDVATGAFHGEQTRVLTALAAELERRGNPVPDEAVQPAVLTHVHRHGREIRALASALSERIGAAGAGPQRRASSADGVSSGAGLVRFVSAASEAEQVGMIAHRLRSRRLGIDGDAEPVSWRDMAVICRSGSDVQRVMRQLEALEVPTAQTTGGVVLREHQVVRELVRLLQHALGVRVLSPRDVFELVGGVIGGVDPVALRRLRGGIVIGERRAAAEDGRESRELDRVIAEELASPSGEALVDSRGGRRLRRVLRAAAAGRAEVVAGASAREPLWAVWDALGVASDWQDEALSGTGTNRAEAHRALDAVMGLFFALQRHEEQSSSQPVAELLDDILTNTLPEDTLARRSERDLVMVTTPQGTVGRSYEIAVVVGLQEGAWPNLRPRGSVLGVTVLERWLADRGAQAPSRRDTLHDELRLLLQACTRARGELLVVSVADDDQHPGPFFGFGAEWEAAPLPSSRLTLRGVTAGLRRRLADDPDDGAAIAELCRLVEADVRGAHPDEWYGVLPPSSTAPLSDLDGDPEARVRVSPSQIDRAETCPLDWVIGRLSRGGGTVSSGIGTLVHRAFETASIADPEELMRVVDGEWGRLPFDAEWESARAHAVAEQMVRGVCAYLDDFTASSRSLVGREISFGLEIDQAVVTGIADRLELTVRDDGVREMAVVDLKTGKQRPSAADTLDHPQMQAYQLGVAEGAFDAEGGGEARIGGARLLFVHPDAMTKDREYMECVQEPLDAERRNAFADRVRAVARVMAGGSFVANVEHHCSDPHKFGGCAIHIIPGVSHA